MPVSMPSETGNNFLSVIKGEKIGQLQHIEPISQALRYCMVLVGLRANNLPSQEEKAVLIGFIRNNYGGHTAEEIKLAFTMAINGELGMAIEDVKCYENFSVLYFSSIMNAYREWAALQHRTQVKDIPPVQTILTDDQLDDIHREDIENFYQRCRNGKQPYNTPDYFKRILVKDELMTQEETVSSFFVRKLGSNAENIYVK